MFGVQMETETGSEKQIDQIFSAVQFCYSLVKIMA